MSKTKRYYVRQTATETIVEKSEILDKEKYIVDVVTQSDEPFEMLKEGTVNYISAVNSFLAIETDTVVAAPVFLE